jgi:predicted dehydrogenase
MLEQMEREIDAVVVSTPDHTHAVASVMALRMGMHCYCEKPLTHSVYDTQPAWRCSMARRPRPKPHFPG